MARKAKTQTLGVLDSETDPFKRGRIPEPFCFGLYVTYNNDERIEYDLYWEKELGNFDSEFDRLINDLANIHGYIYAHNGGKFDFHFVLERLLIIGIEVLECKMIKSRIAKIRFGNVTLLDSFLLIPVSLNATGQKLEFEYWKTERSIEDLTIDEKKAYYKDRSDAYDKGIIFVKETLGLFKDVNKFEVDYLKGVSPREFYRKECEIYLKQDCKGLLDVLKEFIRLYGFGLTLASRAFAAIKESGYEMPRALLHSHVSTFGDFDALDSYFRKWFFGGRVQCFEVGKIEGNIKYYDINSAYPFAMTKNHWAGHLSAYYTTTDWKTLTKAELASSLISLECTSFGAFPLRNEQGGISFPEHTGTFNVTGHEFAMALKLGLVTGVNVTLVNVPLSTANFGKFVRLIHKRKNEADKAGNKLQRLIHKLIMNSGYGRLAIDPRDWMDHRIVSIGEYDGEMAKEGWDICERFEELGFDFLERQTSTKKMVFHNVATAASITGYVRSMLMHAISSVETPLYCDTDSVICKGDASLDFGHELGQWELEAEGKKGIFIAGKKLYALEEKSGEWKTASKGVRLEPYQICKVAMGEEQTWQNFAPSFNIKTFGKIKAMVSEAESLEFRKVFIERRVNLREAK